MNEGSLLDSLKILIIGVLELDAHSLVAGLCLLTAVKVFGHLALAVSDWVKSCRFVDCLIIQKIAIVLRIFSWAPTVRNLAHFV